MTWTTSRRVRKHLEQCGQRGRTDLEKWGKNGGKEAFHFKGHYGGRKNKAWQVTQGKLIISRCLTWVTKW